MPGQAALVAFLALHLLLLGLIPCTEAGQFAASSSSSSSSSIEGQGSSSSSSSIEGQGGSSSSSTSSSSSSTSSSHNSAQPAQDCSSPSFYQPQPLGVRYHPLKAGQRPNFIVILTDDQGWDDVGVNNPTYVSTPNLDRFIRLGLLLDNVYTTPQCAQSRAMLLTGRSHPRTGTMQVNGGWDFLNSNESTAGKVMAAAGYRTAHFGKWHNGDTAGYEPWNVGFQDSWGGGQPTAAGNILMCKNGQYYVANGTYFEEALMDAALGFISNHTASSPQQPFFIYYATHAIHLRSVPGSGGGGDRRVAAASSGAGRGYYPPSYKARYTDPKYQGIAQTTIDAWALLEYLDDVLGRLFDFLEASGLVDSTYVMLGGDNGPAILPTDRRSLKYRMPSGMRGGKSMHYEGGIRNFLAVQGPGVAAGCVDSTLLSLADVLPTVADLGGATDPTTHLLWDGSSFKNLLSVNATVQNSTGHKSAVPSQGSGYRGTSLASAEQLQRYVFILSEHCWDADAVPVLSANREVARSQPLFDFFTGGRPNAQYGPWIKLPKNRPGFVKCTVVLQGEYKWMGLNGKVYRFTGSNHVDSAGCNEVPEPLASALAANFSAAAQGWWASVAAGTTSFNKPVFYLGYAGQTATNVLAMGAHDRPLNRVVLVANGARGFRFVGDRMCFAAKVMTAAVYEVVIMFTSKVEAAFKLSIGSYAAIVKGTAPAVTALLLPRAVMAGATLGRLYLPATPPNTTQEVCLQLLSTTAPGTDVFTLLGALRFTMLLGRRKNATGSQPRLEADVGTAAAAASASIGAVSDAWDQDSSRLSQPDVPTAAAAAAAAALGSGGQGGGRTAAVTAPIAQAATGLDLSGRFSWLLELLPDADQLRSSSSSKNTLAAAWDAVRLQQGWPEGQAVLESMYSPYDSEGIEQCQECQVEV